MIDLSSNPEKYLEIKATTEEEVKCICRLCGSVYKERPFICKCRSNVFLINGSVINGKFVYEKKDNVGCQII